jgi:alkylated DNA repair dioxygenase AlkB
MDMGKSSRQLDLFGLETLTDLDRAPGPTRPIPGLTYHANFIDEQAHDMLLEKIDSENWLVDLKRRVQHYGYKYDYKSRRIDQSMRLGTLPQWVSPVIQLLQEASWFQRPPDQLIVNEYLPGQGIFNHVDCVPCFADTIASLSLGSSCVMDYKNKATGEIVPVLLEPRSLVVMTGEARFDWLHGIASRKTDTFGGRTLRRSRRVSLTFRHVLLD